MSDTNSIVERYPRGEVFTSTEEIEVYRSIDSETGRPVVVKILSPIGQSENEPGRERFLRVAKAVQSLGARGFPRVIEAGIVSDGRAFLVTEHVEGEPFSGRTSAPPHKLLGLLRQTVDALEELARNEISHQNLDPDNILVVGGAGKDEVRLLGLGSPAYFGRAGRGETPGDAEGAGRFIAPELRGPEADTEGGDWRCDLYSFALVATEVLQAEVKGEGTSTPTIALPASACGVLVDSERLTRLLELALRPDPGQRRVGWTDLRDALRWLEPELTAQQKTMAIPIDRLPLIADQDSASGPAGEESKDAAGEPPMAVGDEFAMDQDSELVIPAPGVLVNDTDAKGRKLTALLVAGPASGTLTLDPDGSFRYLPQPGFSGTDSFTYRAFNGEIESPPATVAISVEKVAAPSDADGSQGQFDIDKTIRMPLPDGIPDRPGDSDSEQKKVTDKTAAFPSEPREEESGVQQHAEDRPSPQPPSPTPVFELLSRLRIPALRRPQLSGKALAGIGGALVLLAIIVLAAVWAGRSREAPAPSPVVTPTPVTSRVSQSADVLSPAIHPALEQARIALVDEGAEAARSHLAVLTEDEINTFSEDERALFDEITAALNGSRRDQLVEDLRGGFRWSSVKMLRRAVTGLTAMEAEEIASVRGLAGDLERAREALRRNALMLRVRDEGDSVRLLERSSAVIEMLPDYSVAIASRKEAAASLEAAGDAAAQEGRFEDALSAVEPITRFWPQREGIDARIARYRQLQEEDRKRKARESSYEEVLDAAADRGKAGAPDEGLRMLENRTAPSSLAKRKEDLMAQLAAQLAKLDGSLPKVEVAQGTELRYQKNRQVVIAFVITDDYRVVKAELMFRAQGSAQYRALSPVGRDGDVYSFEIGPELHENSDLDIYVEATDVSGHVGRLGDPSDPLSLKRKGFLKRIIGG